MLLLVFLNIFDLFKFGQVLDNCTTMFLVAMYDDVIPVILDAADTAGRKNTVYKLDVPVAICNPTVEYYAMLLDTVQLIIFPPWECTNI